jgi:hypothetical protein
MIRGKPISPILAIGPPVMAKIVAAYDYRDQRGKLLYQVVRYQPKDFRYRRPKGEGWLWLPRPLRCVPYRLPELLAAPSDERVFIVEGEKDVESLRAIGLTATTNSGGGGRGKWPRSHNRFLRGRNVVILPDNDAVGLAHGEDIAESLTRYTSSVRLLKLPDLPKKGDVTDWLNSPRTKADFQLSSFPRDGDITPWLNSPRTKADLLELAARVAPSESAPRPIQFGASIEDDTFWRWTVAPFIAETLPDKDLSAQEKLLLIIRRLPFKHPKKLTQDVVSSFMGLTVRRIKQMVASLRQRGKIERQARRPKHDGR